MKPGRYAEMQRQGRFHLERSVVLYQQQMADGLFSLHEFPNGSSSVNEPCLDDLINTPGVYLVKGPMCVWGMTSKDAQGEGLVK